MTRPGHVHSNRVRTLVRAVAIALIVPSVWLGCVAAKLGGPSVSRAAWRPALQVRAQAAAGAGLVGAWGGNDLGELGSGALGPDTCGSGAGATRCSTVPVQAKNVGGVGILSGVVAIAAGSEHSLALRSDGSVVAWGSNLDGELGDGTTAGPGSCGLSGTRLPCSTAPVEVEGVGGVGALSGIVAIAAGGIHSLALRSDGTVVAWGSNHAGQLGDGTLTDRSAPVQVHGVGGVGILSGVVAIAAGGLHSLAVRSDGSVVAWGNNIAGQLGDGTSTGPATCPPTGGQPCSTTPVQVEGVGGAGALSGVVAVAAGARHSLALRSDGSVVAWGSNPIGELGVGTRTGPERCPLVGMDPGDPCSTTPVQVHGVGGVGTLAGVAAVAAGQSDSLALRSDGSVVAWGSNEFGLLGQGTTTGPETCSVRGSPQCSTTPVQVKGTDGAGTLSGVVAIAGGSEHSLALRSDGGVVAWGWNSSGQLGTGTTTDSSTPAQVKSPCGTGTLKGVLAIAGGGRHGLAVDSAPLPLCPSSPALSRLVLSRRLFPAAPSGPSALAAANQRYGTLISYTDSQRAVTVFSVQRATAGRLIGGRCVRRTKVARPHARRCTLYLTLGRFEHDDKAGRNRLLFTGRTNHHKLPRGHYRLKATARSNGKVSRPRYASFQITR